MPHLLLLAGCAKIGIPLPPMTHPPEMIDDVQLIQVADRVELIFSLPPQPIRDLQVFRGCQPGEERIVSVIEREFLQGTSRPGQFMVRDRLPGSPHPCRYRLRTIGVDTTLSPFSSAILASPRVALPPTDLVAEVLQDRIVVRWRPPSAELEGGSPAPILGFLVNSKVQVSSAEFLDRDFAFGQTRIYRVQTISRTGNPLILSDFSDTLEIRPQDIFPPAAPQNVSIVKLEDSVQLIWDPNGESDLQGYSIYRQIQGERMSRLPSPVKTNSYLDPLEKTQGTVHYQVSAVDSSGNESEPSAPALVTVP